MTASMSTLRIRGVPIVEDEDVPPRTIVGVTRCGILVQLRVGSLGEYEVESLMAAIEKASLGIDVPEWSFLKVELHS